jgi:hypothetical protein
VRHQLFVQDLVRPRLHPEIALVGSIQGQDHEDDEADESREQADLDAVDAFVVYWENRMPIPD